MSKKLKLCGHIKIEDGEMMVLLFDDDAYEEFIFLPKCWHFCPICRRRVRSKDEKKS